MYLIVNTHARNAGALPGKGGGSAGKPSQSKSLGILKHHQEAEIHKGSGVPGQNDGTWAYVKNGPQ